MSKEIKACRDVHQNTTNKTFNIKKRKDLMLIEKGFHYKSRKKII
jgi:hypothetical protein